jgi:hypothetical protein
MSHILARAKGASDMPVYEYVCPANNLAVEVTHGMNEKASTWGELCRLAGLDPGETPPGSPVERLIFPVGISTPAGNTKLKEMGFTKLVKRDTGVYENVTATGTEKRYMTAGDASSLPDLKRKIRD